MANFEILEINDFALWSECFQAVDSIQQDVYLSSEYYSVYNDKYGKAQCFIFRKDSDFVIYPFLKNNINDLGFNLKEEYYDIQGAYGYNGILTNSIEPTFISSFFESFDDYCNNNNIIAEFVRINPITDNLFRYRNNFENIFDRENVFVNLLEENIFKTEYDYSTQKNIRKALSYSLTYQHYYGNEISYDKINVFYQIYYETMKRNQADEFYFFNEEYFFNIAKTLKEKALFVFTFHEGIAISCELVLLSNIVAYSFLGGTLSSYFYLRPNDFLKNETINYLKANGFHFFLLGGGSEGVLKFKKSFSKNGVIPFYIGKKIHNSIIYNQVVSQWEERFPQKRIKYGKLLLKYRF